MSYRPWIGKSYGASRQRVLLMGISHYGDDDTELTNTEVVHINGETHYLWRAVNHEGEVLEVFASKRRDRMAALAVLTRAMKRYGCPGARPGHTIDTVESDVSDVAGAQW